MESAPSIDNICANCGKGEENCSKLQKCSACLSVKYCSRECQAAHRPQHKKECKKRAAELHDEKLFADPPPREECPICFQPLPIGNQKTFESCCGKVICNGCIYAMSMSEEGADLCPFCRTERTNSNEEIIKRLKKLMDKDNGEAFLTLGGCYADGELDLAQDYRKANELFLKGAQFGCAEAYYNLGLAHDNGTGVEVDGKKADYYYKLAAIGGCVEARNNLGCMKGEAENKHRAIKHYILAARAGYKDSLDMVEWGCNKR